MGRVPEAEAAPRPLDPGVFAGKNNSNLISLRGQAWDSPLHPFLPLGHLASGRPWGARGVWVQRGRRFSWRGRNRGKVKGRCRPRWGRKRTPKGVQRSCACCKGTGGTRSAPDPPRDGRFCPRLRHPGFSPPSGEGLAHTCLGETPRTPCSKLLPVLAVERGGAGMRERLPWRRGRGLLLRAWEQVVASPSAGREPCCSASGSPKPALSPLGVLLPNITSVTTRQSYSMLQKINPKFLDLPRSQSGSGWDHRASRAPRSCDAFRAADCGYAPSIDVSEKDSQLPFFPRRRTQWYFKR